MQMLTTTLDSVYFGIVEGTVSCIHSIQNIFSPREEQGVVVQNEEEYAPAFPHIPDIHENQELTFKTVGEIFHAEVGAHASIQKNTIMYANTPSVPIYKNPTVEFDMQIGEIPYGEMVIVLEPKGRFYRIMWQTTEGWVFRDDIADRAVRVYPEFVVGGENSIDSSNTVQVRAILGDPFGIGRSEFPLQAGEYVLYKLWKKGIKIPWPSVRPRVPGLWHKILKGSPRVHVGVTPKVHAIMEYVYDAEIGHVAFVEAVFPDDTVIISEANFPDSGIYNERELSKEEWKELKPVFITVS